jgi:hypothetical protein
MADPTFHALTASNRSLMGKQSELRAAGQRARKQIKNANRSWPPL